MAGAAGWGFAAETAFTLGPALVLRGLAGPRASAKVDFALALLVAASLAIRLIRREHRGRFLGWSAAIGGALYVGGLAAFFPALRALPDGFIWVMLAFTATWSYDMGAFVGGTLFGRRPLMPHISPAKTWEGVATGVAAVAACLGVFLAFLPIEPWHIAVAGPGFAAAAQIGDLLESAIKREAGVKNSGRLVPGHGGILDRVDSLLFTAPFVYLFAVLVLRMGPLS